MHVQTIAKLLPEERLPLKRFAMSITKNPDRAEDLVQDTMERALLKAHLFDGENVRGWLWTMCRRIFLNDLRRNRHSDHTVDLDEAPPTALMVGHAQEASLEVKQVMEAFQTLPIGDRIVLSLVVVDGLSYIEASTALQIPVGTVRSRLSRARARLGYALATRSEWSRRTNPPLRPQLLCASSEPLAG